MALLIIGESPRTPDFAKATQARAPDREVRLWPNVGNAADVRYALAWGPPPGELKAYANLQMIVSVGAGVDHLFRDPELPDVPIVRYVDHDLTARMTGYVVLHALLHCRRMTEYADQQRRAIWNHLPEPAPQAVRVGVMGAGVLGHAAVQALGAVEFQVNAWSRTAKQISGARCFAGQDGLADFLAETDILVVLLPLTPNTKGLINADLLAQLSQRGRPRRLPGPVLINAGRGGLQVETAILQALDDRSLYAASLDVFETEPLDRDSPLWQHPRVVITPHNAAESTTESIVAYFLKQVAQHEAGQAPDNVVDRSLGY
ncbi:MAG: glyoxylate/hydroxypyruvate reductase A [Pseudomonadota bacterium]